MDSAIFFEAPLRLDLGLSPRLAANAAPAAICCFFDFAGILLIVVPAASGSSASSGLLPTVHFDRNNMPGNVRTSEVAFANDLPMASETRNPWKQFGKIDLVSEE